MIFLKPFWVRLIMAVFGEKDYMTREHFVRWRDLFHYRLYAGSFMVTAFGAFSLIWKLARSF